MVARTLQKLTTYRSGCSQHLIDVLFGQSDVGPPYAAPKSPDGTQGGLYLFILVLLFVLYAVFGHIQAELCHFEIGHPPNEIN